MDPFSVFYNFFCWKDDRRNPDYFVEFIKSGETMLKVKTPAMFYKNSLISKFKIQITGDTTSSPYNYEFLAQMFKYHGDTSRVNDTAMLKVGLRGEFDLDPMICDSEDAAKNIHH